MHRHLTGRHGAADWAMLAALTLMWGSSFLLTKVAVGGLPPDLVVAGRLLVGACLVVPLAWLLAARPVAGMRLWVFYTLIAVFGNVLPFSLIAWGQKFIDSGLAGILMAIMPLATLGLAHFLVPGERMTAFRAIGFLMGFAGVVVLMGPDALSDLANGEGHLLPMLSVLGGALCYAVSSILARLRPPSDALFSAASTISLASLIMLPILFMTGELELHAVPEVPHLLAVILLGVFSTAIATVVYFRLVKSAGPSFVSQLNYLIPLWAVGVGMVFLGEQPQATHVYALGLILSGILVTQLERRRLVAGLRRRLKRSA